MFENNDDRTAYIKYYLPTVEIKDYYAMIDGQNTFGQLVKNSLRTYDNVWNIAVGQGDDYATGCLLDYNCFNNYHKMIGIDLSKQQVLNADPKAIQEINFTGNLNRQNAKGQNINVNTKKFFIIEESKETILDFSKWTFNSLWMWLLILFYSNIISR